MEAVYTFGEPVGFSRSGFLPSLEKKADAGNAAVFLLSVKVNRYRYPYLSKPVLRIRVNLVRIRIRGSVPLTNGSGSCYFVIDLQDANKIRSRYPTVLKLLPLSVFCIRDVLIRIWIRGSVSLEWFSAYLFLECTFSHLHHFLKIKGKRSYITIGIVVFRSNFALRWKDPNKARKQTDPDPWRCWKL